MYRRGAVHIVILLLVVLVGSGVAQQLSGNQLVVTGSGPNAIGGQPSGYAQMSIKGTFNPTGTDLYSQIFETTLSPGVNNNAYIMRVYGPNTRINKAASGTHAEFGSVVLDAPTVSGGAAALSTAFTLKVNSTPSSATSNYALWVAQGSTRLDGMLRVGGDVQIDGNIAAKYQDVAEWVPSAHSLAAGTVAIIDGQASNHVVASNRPYDIHVAGVVSTRPGVLLGEGGADKIKLAHSGRVMVKADARYGAITIGDLLVTSGTPGHAMRSEPLNIGGAEIHRPGTIIGKALEPLPTGQGAILILLTLQ